MKLSDFDYNLPPERIAQTPLAQRDASRLLALDRKSGKITHTQFNQLGKFLNPGDLLVANQTRVIPARLYAKKVPTGGQVEILLLNRRDELTWEAMAGGKRVTLGKRLAFEDGPEAEIVEVLDGPRRLVRFDQPIEPYLEKSGNVPLPPYIHKTLEDPERYQTVYAQAIGSAAAPTAGLHFTPELIEALKGQGIGFETVTLHVGLDTFAPVTEEDVTQHHIHTEWCQMSAGSAQAVNQAKERGKRVVAVGTTSVRVLESAAQDAENGKAAAQFEGPTGLYILPGYEFRAVDVMITNFHLPRSTLLMLVSAFAGRELILEAYREAIREEYRFYSFGDAMLMF